MQHSISLKIEKFNENGKDYFIATSLDILGLVAEADTIDEVLAIAADLVPLLLELEDEKTEAKPISVVIPKEFEYPLILSR
jgi:predicted RNase H-like HicB family nuclease